MKENKQIQELEEVVQESEPEPLLQIVNTSGKGPKWAIGWAIVIGLALAGVFSIPFLQCCAKEEPVEGVCKVLRDNPPWFLLSAIAAVPAILLTWYWRDQHKRSDILNAEESQITERFTRAVEHLGSEKTEIRVGGIYALERISKDSQRDHWTIVETLSAFIRHRARRSEASPDDDEPEPVSMDVQAALTVIGRRSWQETESTQIDLSLSEFSHAFFRNPPNFENAVFTGSSLWGAELEGANFIGARLYRTSLVNTNLVSAKLIGAEMRFAMLKVAVLTDADLSHADLFKADLAGASLLRANMHGVNLRSANLHEADLEGAYIVDANLKNAILTNS